jgi:hypothetical protein
MTHVTTGHQLGWPTGLHTNEDAEGDDITHRQYYCSIHDKYSYRGKISITVDWAQWYRRRAPRKLRMGKGHY